MGAQWTKTVDLARRALVVLVASAVGAAWSAVPGCAQPAPRAAAGGVTRPGAVATTPADSIPRPNLIESAALASMLKAPAARRPVVLHVGFKRLYGTGHIPGSTYAGPASKPEGVAAIRKALRSVPRQKTVVLYCGCCPWQHCPNVRPAYQTARGLGFKDVRVLFVAQDLQTDWGDKGYPLVEGDK